MSEENIFHISTYDMPWSDDPDIPGFKQKVLSEDKNTGAVVRQWFVPPGWGDEALNGKPDRHYHKTVIERGFHLYGDFPHWEFNSVDDFKGDLSIFKPGLFMDRPPGSLHGLLPEPKSQAGTVNLSWDTGRGTRIREPEFADETITVPFDRDAEVDVDGFTTCRFLETRLMPWEKHPKVEDWKIKYLSTGDEGGDSVCLVFIPYNWSFSNTPEKIAISSQKPWFYVLSGDLIISSESNDFKLMSDDYFGWERNAPVKFSSHLLSETGCVALCSGHLM